MIGSQLRPSDEANGHFQIPDLVLGQSLQRVLRKSACYPHTV
jgi:hypothetical protein